MKKILAVLVALIAAFLWTVALPSASPAITCVGSVCEGGDVHHHADTGYDPSIIVVCDWNDAFWPGGNPKGWSLVQPHARYVAEGTSSKADCGVDTDVIWLRNGEHLVCVEYPGPDYGPEWYTFFDATGPHKIVDTWSEDCALKAD